MANEDKTAVAALKIPVGHRPFPKGPPHYSLLCRDVTFVEFTAFQLGKRLPRAIEHNVPVKYDVTTGNADTAAYLMLLLKGRGLDPHSCSREDWRQKGHSHRVDKLGDGPVVFGIIPVDHLVEAYRMLGHKYKAGTVVAQAQVALTTPEVLGQVAKRIENERPQ